MNTVTLGVRTLADTLADFKQAWESDKPSEVRISFETPELLWQVLSAKRWEIIKVMTGAGSLSIREVARRVQRDVKAVHGDVHVPLEVLLEVRGDVHVLLDAGILEREKQGVCFPYDAVHVDFMLDAA